MFRATEANSHFGSSTLRWPEVSISWPEIGFGMPNEHAQTPPWPFARAGFFRVSMGRRCYFARRFLGSSLLASLALARESTWSTMISQP